jgi:hypothetical protein
VSIDVAELASRKIIGDSGCGHRMIISTVNFQTKLGAFSKKLHYDWNIRKAKWHEYR